MSEAGPTRATAPAADPDLLRACSEYRRPCSQGQGRNGIDFCSERGDQPAHVERRLHLTPIDRAII